MVILLDGSSSVGRVTIAEKAVAEHEAWRHLALEVFADASVPGGEESEGHLKVIKTCAESLAADGLHLLLTLPSDSPHRDILAEALKPDCTTVHLGSAEDGDYDFAIDPSSSSVNDVVALLDTIMNEAE